MSRTSEGVQHQISPASDYTATTAWLSELNDSY